MSSLNPLPQSLRAECDKAAKILREFTIPNSKVGTDKLIPQKLLATCKGIAIITVIRAGFLFTMRAGSGLIVSRLQNGEWSAPSAIALGGMGGGFDIGGEITNFVIILNTRSAVSAFSKGGNVTLGGNISVAAGPVGRNAEVDVSVRCPSAIYTYSRTRGLFIGMSIEGSVLIERKAANRKIYGQEVRAKSLLSGVYPQPREAANLYIALNEVSSGVVTNHTTYQNKTSSYKRRSTSSKSFSKPPSKPAPPSSSTHFFKFSRGSSNQTKADDSSDDTCTGSAPAQGFFDMIKKQPTNITSKTDFKAASRKIPAHVDWSKNPTAKALHDFKGDLPCDLSFKQGDKIEILTRTDTTYDWWEGQIGSSIGIFPANYVMLE